MSFSASPLPNAKKVFLDANGVPLAGGSVGYYVPGTLTPKTTWADENQATPNSTIIILDSAGRAVVFGSGDYREIVKDINGNTIWDAVTNISLVSGAVSGTEIIASGNVVAGAWTTFGLRVQLQSATYTDTTSNGTVATVVVDANNAPTIAASNAVTYTNAYTQYVSNPSVGANVTFTNAWALGADSLRVNGNVSVASTGTVTGPDAGTWSSVGITNISNMFVGSTTAANTGDVGVFDKPTNGPTGVTILNLSTGTNALTTLYFGNSTGNGDAGIIQYGTNNAAGPFGTGRELKLFGGTNISIQPGGATSHVSVTTGKFYVGYSTDQGSYAMAVNGTGYFGGGVILGAANTTANAANVYYDYSSTGQLQRYTSTIRIKKNIRYLTTADSGPLIDAAKPIFFNSTAGTDDPTEPHFGVLAEDIAQMQKTLNLNQRQLLHWIPITELDRTKTPPVGYSSWTDYIGTNQQTVNGVASVPDAPKTLELIAVLLMEVQSLRARLKAAGIA